MSLKPWCLAMLSWFALSACVSREVREPASVKPLYSASDLAVLHQLSSRGIAVVMSNQVLKDIEYEKIKDRCITSHPIPWATQIIAHANALAASGGLDKIHLIEIRRADDQPRSEYSADLDGLSTLTIQYKKTEQYQTVANLQESPCLNKIGSDVGATKIIGSTVWPSTSESVAILSRQPNRIKVERFNYDPTFLNFLADRATLFWVDRVTLFEVDKTNQSIVNEFMNRTSAEIKNGFLAQNLDYWLAQITKRSEQGHRLKVFSLNADHKLATGIQVDSQLALSRQANGSIDPSYVFVNYAIKENEFNIPTLQLLDLCLADLTSKDKSITGLSLFFERDPKSFLNPGFSCSNTK